MATIKRPKGEIILNRSEREILTHGLDQWGLAEAKRRGEELRRRSRNMRKLRSGLMSATGGPLKKTGPLQPPMTQKQLIASARLGKPGRRSKQSSTRNAIFGLNFGIEVPPYDFSWQPLASVAPQSIAPFVSSGADEMTGYLWATSTADSQILANTQMDAYAGVGFWYVPDRPGILNLFSTPQIHYLTAAGATNDYGNADVWIYMGVQRFTKDPFGPDGDMLGYSPYHLDSIDIGWYDDQSHDKLLPNHFINTAVFVDPDHFYACWIWISADTGRNDEGYGEAFIEAAIGGINFFLL